MRYVKLGTTGIEVSAIAFGAMSLGYKNPDQETYDQNCIRAVARAYELGINLFDTADVYGPHKSELLLGQAIRSLQIPREKIVIASKCAILFAGQHPEYTYKAYDTSAAYIVKSCEESLKRLNTDYLDLYQLHRIDYLTHPEEVAEAFARLKKDGKIRHAAVSNYSADEVRMLSAYTRLESNQIQFNILHQEPLETGIFAVALEKRMNLLAWSPLEKGMLSGKHNFLHRDWKEQRGEGVVTQLRKFAEKYEVTVSQLALAWLMQLPGGTIPLMGTSKAEHVENAVGAIKLNLKRDDWYEIMVIGRGRMVPFYQQPFAYLKER